MDVGTGLTRDAAPAAAGADLWRLGVLPVMALGALSGLIGIYWDIAWHIDKGRDSFFSPPHNFIYLAMAIVLVVTLYGLVRDRRGSALHLRLGRARLQPGLLITAVGASLELLFAPADDLWHRLFGADVTLWAPMHLIGVLGLTLLSFGALVASWVERRLAAGVARRRLFAGSTVFFAAVLLGWLSLLLAEYEFVVPAFPMLWHPLLLTGLPAFVLVLIARLNPMPFAATWTAVGFTVVRLLLAGWLLAAASLDLAGDTKPAIPLLLLAGLAADLLAWRTPLWLAGIGIGLASFAVNYPLTFVSSLDWHPGALAVGLPVGLALAVVAAYLGAWVATALEPAPSRRSA